jgi:hypothetical protein
VNGKSGGVVVVRSHQEVERQGYEKQLATAAVVHLKEGKAEPGSIEIFAGQTVVWVVESGKGVVIRGEPAGPKPQPVPTPKAGRKKK